MASTLQKFVIPIFGYCNFQVPLLMHFIEDLATTQVEALTVFIRIKARLIYTQGLKYMPGSATE